MDADFEAELRREGVPDALITWMSTRCPTASRFAFFVDDQPEIGPEIVDQVPETRGNRTVRAALAELWLKYRLQAKHRLTREAAGIRDADIEEPLDDTAQKRLMDTFSGYYHFRLRSHSILCDPLLARLKRETDKNTHTVLPVTRIKSQAVHGRTSSAKKVKISEYISMDVAHHVEVYQKVPDTQTYIQALQLLMNGYAVVGCFEVRHADGTMRAARWAPWDVCCEYVTRAQGKAARKAASVDVLRRADESTREQWCDWMRLDGLTLGEAIERSFVECSPYWLFGGVDVAPEIEEEEAFSRGFAKHQTAAIASRDAKPKSVPAPPLPASASKQSVATSTTRGKPICPDWNCGKCADKGPCPKGALHVCNFLLSNGVPCNSTAHRRCDAH